MVVDELDRLRASFAECGTIAFADLSTQMVLVTDSAADLPREALDRLCGEASLMLGAGKSPAPGHTDGTTAVVSQAEGLRIFMRASDVPSDALCCVCAPGLDLTAFLADARACLDRISAADA